MIIVLLLLLKIRWQANELSVHKKIVLIILEMKNFK